MSVWAYPKYCTGHNYAENRVLFIRNSDLTGVLYFCWWNLATLHRRHPDLSLGYVTWVVFLLAGNENVECPCNHYSLWSCYLRRAILAAHLPYGPPGSLLHRVHPALGPRQVAASIGSLVTWLPSQVSWWTAPAGAWRTREDAVGYLFYFPGSFLLGCGSSWALMSPLVLVEWQPWV